MLKELYDDVQVRHRGESINGSQASGIYLGRCTGLLQSKV